MSLHCDDNAPVDLILHPTDLRAGDVMLYRPVTPDLFQRGIIKLTASPYTHAAIFLGNGVLAEAVPIRGVVRTQVENGYQDFYIAVLRSQLCFSDARADLVNAFIDDVIATGRFYDLWGAARLPWRSSAHAARSLDLIRNNFGKLTSRDEFSRQSFFCSAFVIACYSIAGIIGDSAQVYYQPKAFAPGHLPVDPTFGWLLGYLVPQGLAIPHDDPVLLGSTHWRDMK